MTPSTTTKTVLLLLCWSNFLCQQGHAFTSGSSSLLRTPFGLKTASGTTPSRRWIEQCRTRRSVSLVIIDAGNSTNEEPEEEEDEEPESEDPYLQVAASEFQDKAAKTKAPPGISSLTTSPAASSTPRTTIDWGGALGKLRQRMEDVEMGKSQNPSQVLFRLMSSQTPNQAIGSFVSSANPDVVQAMSGAVSALLGGLSNPAMGIETIVKASGEKIGSLCFQLQMTGYMFRNAEYVMALRNLMNIKGTATWQDYKDAFDRLDQDGSGYIEASEIAALLDDVYKGKAEGGGATPAFEIKAFLKFFDENKDGKISWDEFERGLGVAIEKVQQQQQQQKQLQPNASSKQQQQTRLLPEQKKEDDDDDDEDDDDEELLDLQADISGTIEIEVKDGQFVEVEAKEYIQSLKAEAEALKKALQQETMGKGLSPAVAKIMPPTPLPQENEAYGGIANYIASRRGDVKALTEGISPEVVDTMKMLVDFVLEGGDASKKNGKTSKAEMEMELPGSALQQLALWQLVLGYRLREAEATGDYLKLLE